MIQITVIIINFIALVNDDILAIARLSNCFVIFNEALMMLAAILADMGVQCSRITLAQFASMDKERNRCKAKVVTDTKKRRRRLLKSQFVSAE